MADTPDLNPKPVPGPAEVTAQPTQAVPASVPAANPTPQTQSTWAGAFAAVGTIFEQLKKNPEPAYLFIGVYTVLAIIDILSYGYASPMSDDSGNIESLGLLIFLLALPTYALALADRKSITVTEFMKFDLGRYLTLFGVLLLTVLLYALAAIPLLIPLIWVIPWLVMGNLASVDHKLSVVDSLKESKRLAQDHKGAVWGVIGASILMALAAAALSFIPVVGSAASAAITLLTSGAMALLYRWLQKNVPAAV